ncbi:MAG: prepilin-type N-terminal cleavage/methylation domain-containing protein [Kiritimatiellae bacterium]|nr:prepilin-type N-terminal cleavage/methylation domain-containing protein [Kiritimatiellia bacterium]
MIFNRHNSGFTLIEVTLAILVIAIGALTLFSLMPEGLSMGRNARNDMRNVLLANAILGDVRGYMMEKYEPGGGLYQYFDPVSSNSITGNGTLVPLNDAGIQSDSIRARIGIDFYEVVPNELCEVCVSLYPPYGTNNIQRYFSQYANYHKPQ